MSEKECDNPVEEETVQEEGMTLDEVQKEQELLDYKNKYLQALAENENTRKRLQKEKGDAMRFAVQNVLEEFLSPLDNFENALGYADKMSDEVKNWAVGFEMILTQLKNVLSEQGVTPFDSVGTQFDPNLHEAVEVEVSETHDEGIVLEEFVRGYRCGERILRPAKVKVAKKESIKEEKGENNGE